MPSQSTSDRDRTLINDILRRSEKLSVLFADVNEAKYLEDDVLQLAAERLISIIGEAASRISVEARNAMPDVPWREMSSTRNRLMHDYAGVENSVVYRIATVSVPEMVVILKKELANLG